MSQMIPVDKNALRVHCSYSLAIVNIQCGQAKSASSMESKLNCKKDLKL